MPAALLAPRYKVIADYPGSPYKVGEIKHCAEWHSGDVNYYKQYEYIFKPLEWWEERKVEEMPEYLKCIKTPDQTHFPDEVYKMEWLGYSWGKTGKGMAVTGTNCYLPATESEYLSYIEGLKK